MWLPTKLQALLTINDGCLLSGEGMLAAVFSVKQSSNAFSTRSYI